MSPIFRQRRKTGEIGVDYPHNRPCFTWRTDKSRLDKLRELAEIREMSVSRLLDHAVDTWLELQNEIRQIMSEEMEQ